MKKIIKHTGWFIKAEWKQYTIMFILLIGISIISLVPAKLLGEAIDTIVSSRLTASTLYLLAGLLLLIPIVRYSMSFLYN